MGRSSQTDLRTTQPEPSQLDCPSFHIPTVGIFSLLDPGDLSATVIKDYWLSLALIRKLLLQFETSSIHQVMVLSLSSCFVLF